MNENQKEPLADAVLDAWELGAQVDYSVAGADLVARRELEQLESTAILAATAIAVAQAAKEPMRAAFAMRLTELGREFTAAAAPRATAGRRRPIGASFWLGLAAGFAVAWLGFGRTADAAPETLREQLMQQARYASVAWQPGSSQTHGLPHGDVVWCKERQEGYLRIEGLEPLPEGHQYQLWIVDANRVGAPVDGGLFDLTRTGEHVVPIQARLPVNEAKAFVVTVEQRGGVVVSEQKDVVAIATL